MARVDGRDLHADSSRIPYFMSDACAQRQTGDLPDVVMACAGDVLVNRLSHQRWLAAGLLPKDVLGSHWALDRHGPAVQVEFVTPAGQNTDAVLLSTTS